MYKVNMDVNNSLFLIVSASASFIDLLAEAGTLNKHIVPFRDWNGKLCQKILKVFSENNEEERNFILTDWKEAVIRFK